MSSKIETVNLDTAVNGNYACSGDWFLDYNDRCLAAQQRELQTAAKHESQRIQTAPAVGELALLSV